MTQAQQPEALRLAAICESKGMFSVADELNRMHARLLELEQGKCLHQIAEPAAAPFMYAIDDGYGKAFFEEQGCVSSEAKDLQPEVDSLNQNLDGEPPYAVVAVYTHPAAPQAVQAAVPATNHSGTPNSSTIIVPHGWKLVPDDATPEWVANLEALPDWREAVGECIKRFLAAAPAHPAEGVPAQRLSQATIDFLKETLKDCDDSARDAAIGHDIEKMLRAATHPTQQGLDAAVIENAERFQFIVDNNLILSGGTKKFGWPIAPFGKECVRYIDKERAAIAAQAKQGGAQP